MNATLERHDVLQMAPHHRLRWEAAQGCHVLLYPEGIVQLNDTAAEILKCCASARTLGTITAEMQATYPDEPVEADVRTFLEEAVAHGWIRVSRS